MEMIDRAADACRRNFGSPDQLVVDPLTFWVLQFWAALRKTCRAGWWPKRAHGRLVACPDCGRKVRAVRGLIPPHLQGESRATRAARLEELRALRSKGTTAGYWRPEFDAHMKREQA